MGSGFEVAKPSIAVSLTPYKRLYGCSGPETRELGPELELGLGYTGTSLSPLHPFSDPLPISKFYLLKVSQPP